MIFWIAVALLAVAVTWAVTQPLMDARGDVRDAGAADLAVYKDQLSEIDADQVRGTLAAGDAEQARTEIARRVLRHAGSDASAARSGAPDAFLKPVLVATTAALPLVSLAIYLTVGAPGQPAQPLAERIAQSAGAAQPNDMIARVEARLRENPEDGQGWNVIAPVYYAMGRYADAASAFATAMRILGETPDRLQGFANARIRTENGIVPEDARAALDRILGIAPDRREPRVWLALAKEQDGKTAEAAAAYRALIADAPADAPWKNFIEQRLAALEGRPSAPAASGAPALDQATVENMAPEERQQLINGMVGRLAARLAADGKDAKGWMMLIRSYQMLGRTADAEKAVTDARRGLAGDAAALADVNGLAKELGLGG